ncbi:MAG: 5-formyltetrahydrofolate cyclo-ligase [Bacteroidales bacterium]|nr:MAG: 5-formyltetrahydrofolate cyclo-ligase [Bacteroidales bacterium]
MNHEEIKNRKKELRKLIKEKKKNFTPENAAIHSAIIFSRVESLSQFKQAKTVLAYWSLPDEVSTHNFVQKWAHKKRIVLPIVIGDTLELRAFNGLESLVTSDSFGIQEPKTGELIDPQEVDFAIIPGIAFDKKGNRLGRGKGYYDRLLKQTNAYKVAVGYDFQVIDEVPVSSFDVSVDLVVSPGGI